ncbi:MAG: hypothetical protein WC785_03990 [Tatlockia sp.]|jgi:hypothetical protein
MAGLEALSKAGLVALSNKDYEGLLNEELNRKFASVVNALHNSGRVNDEEYSTLRQQLASPDYYMTVTQLHSNGKLQDAEYTILLDGVASFAVSDDLFSTYVGKMRYFYQNPPKDGSLKHDPLMVITTVMPADKFGQLICEIEQTWDSGDTERKGILIGLMGQGITENHIVTAYYNGKEILVFDSKASDADRFFGNKEKSFLSNIGSFFRSMLPHPTQKTRIQVGENKIPVKYIALGTQSLFDPATCGYHTAATLTVCKDLLKKRQTLNRENVLAGINDPIREGLPTVQKYDPEKTALAYSDFVNKAFEDTFLTNKKEKPSFSRHFMGWPAEESTARKTLYLSTFGFITMPLINSVELSINLLSETASFLATQLMKAAPTHALTQYARSGLLFGCLAVQKVTDAMGVGILGGIKRGIGTVYSQKTGRVETREEGNNNPAMDVDVDDFNMDDLDMEGSNAAKHLNLNGVDSQNPINVRNENEDSDKNPNTTYRDYILENDDVQSIKDNVEDGEENSFTNTERRKNAP